MIKSGAIISVAVFAIACCLPALEFSSSQGKNDVLWGANILIVGWSGIFAGVMGWFANPFWLLGVILGFMRPVKLAAVAGVCAICIASTTFSLFGQEIPGDEGNVTHLKLLRLLPGCYVWMASLVSLPVVVFLRKPN